MQIMSIYILIKFHVQIYANSREEPAMKMFLYGTVLMLCNDTTEVAEVFEADFILKGDRWSKILIFDTSLIF